MIAAVTTTDNPRQLAIIFGAAAILFLIIGVIIISVTRKLVVKISNPNLCTSLTEGTVIGGSAIHYAGHRTAKVRYEVGGQTYEINGPLFKSGTSGSFVKSNLTTREALPDTLKGPILMVEDGAAADIELDAYSYERSVIAQLYPVGSTAKVWYNPSRPSEAFVERYIDAPDVGILIGGAFIGFGVLWIFVTIICLAM